MRSQEKKAAELKIGALNSVGKRCLWGQVDFFIDTYLSDVGRHAVPAQADAESASDQSTQDRDSKDETLRKRTESGWVWRGYPPRSRRAPQ